MIQSFTLSIFLAYSLTQTAVASNYCVMDKFDEEVINTADTLAAIEQSDLTKGQCEIYKKEFKARRKHKARMSDEAFNRAKVLCGKWIFINLGMKTKIGIPVKILIMIKDFSEVGKDFSGLGFLKDESWDKKWPFGMVESKHHNPVSFKKTSVNQIVQMSCVACHAGKLEDGRISIGASNEMLEYGKFNIYTLYSIWLADKRKYDQTRWLPELIEKYKGMKESNTNSFSKTLEMMTFLPANDFVIKYLIGEEPPPLMTQESFINTKAGIYNGFAPSLNFNDRQIYLTSPQLYGLGLESEAHYGSLAGLEKLDDFIGEAFVYTTRTTKYNKDLYIEPIKEYLKCLKSPKNKKIKNIEMYNKGKKVFTSSCISCHDLKNGAGSEAVDVELINTPDSYLNLFTNYKPTDVQSRTTFKVIQKINLDKSVEKIKVRRLDGIWTRKNLTSNGQIEGMDELFCLNKSTRSDRVTTNPKTQGIHADLCENYSAAEKEQLVEYLLHF